MSGHNGNKDGNKIVSCDVSHFVISKGELTSYELKDEEVDAVCIPANVKRIAKYAFSKSKVRRVVFAGESVESIGNGAFSGCENLEQIEIPVGVKVIERDTFKDCRSLREIDIPEGVEVIGDSAFSGSGLERLYIPSSVTQIGPFAFSDTPHLTEISVDKNNEKFKVAEGILYTKSGEKLVFASRDAENLRVPNGVVEIGPCAFENCKKLALVNICKGAKSVGCAAFRECWSLERISLPDSLEKIGERAFENCYKLQMANIPRRVTSVGVAAFKNCVSLSSLTFDPMKKAGSARPALIMGVWTSYEDTVQTGVVENSTPVEIGDEAFSGSLSLSQAFLPSSLTKIGKGVFFGCSSLEFLCIPKRTSFIGSDAFSGCALYGRLHFCDNENWKREDGKCNPVDVEPLILRDDAKAYDFWVEYVREFDMEKF